VANEDKRADRAAGTVSVGLLTAVFSASLADEVIDEAGRGRFAPARCRPSSRCTSGWRCGCISAILAGVLGYVPDFDEAYATVTRLVDALPVGSYVVVQDGTHTHIDEANAERLRTLMETWDYRYQLRNPEEIGRFLDGLELIEPGVVSSPLWRPGPPNPAFLPATAVDEYCGVGRKTGR
jgi:hypothetical protein